jgi:methionyl-tRNA formyltransferase
MRTLFVGGTKRGYLTLRALLDGGAEIVGIISLRQDEHEVERYEGPIKALAEKVNIPHYETKWMKDRDYVELISKELKPEIAFVVGCRILIPREIYQIPPLGTFAVHDSLLPEYRGFAPLNWSILNGEDQTGVTLFYLSELMDGGDIVAQKRVPIGPDDTAPVVYERVCQATVDLVLEAYPLLVQGVAPRIKQDYTTGSFACSRTPVDGMIDWSKPAIAIYNQVRALTYPYPGAFTYYTGRKLIVWGAKRLDNPPRYVGRIPGRVIGISKSEGYVDVLTGNGILRVFEVQFEGEDRTEAATVITSVRSALGLRVVDLLERIQALEQQVAGLMEDHG